MLTIPLLAVPNQSLSSFLNGKQWGFTVKTNPSGSAFLSVDIDGVAWATSFRMIPNYPIFFNERLAQHGELYLACVSDDTPIDFTQFGVTQNLVYVEPV